MSECFFTINRRPSNTHLNHRSAETQRNYQSSHIQRDQQPSPALSAEFRRVQDSRKVGIPRFARKSISIVGKPAYDVQQSVDCRRIPSRLLPEADLHSVTLSGTKNSLDSV
jgi:hypothetical protein